MQTERRVAANPQTKPTYLDVSPPKDWLLPSADTIAMKYVPGAHMIANFAHPSPNF